MSYTHRELVDRAARWLRGTRKCRVVLTERMSVAEMPDAIGWSAASHLVECKVSRADFHADKSKPWRRMPELGMGAYRWFLAPAGVLRVEDMPQRWGLLEVHARHVKVRREAEYVEGYDKFRRERSLLVSELHRYQLHSITYPPLSDGPPKRTASQAGTNMPPESDGGIGRSPTSAPPSQAGA